MTFLLFLGLALLFGLTLTLLFFGPKTGGRAANKRRSVVSAATSSARPRPAQPGPANVPSEKQSTIADSIKDESDLSPAADPQRVAELSAELSDRNYATLHEVFFHAGTERLRDESWPELRAVAALFQNDAALRLRIDGCSNGNPHLALRRAESVAAYVSQACRIDRARMETSGRVGGGGNRERNRKVQIIKC